MKRKKVVEYIHAVCQVGGGAPYWSMSNDGEEHWEWVNDKWRIGIWTTEEETGWFYVDNNLELSLDESCGSLEDTTPEKLVQFLNEQLKGWGL